MSGIPMERMTPEEIARLTAENRQMLAVLQDTAKLQPEILTGLQAAKATIAALTARVKELEAVLWDIIADCEADYPPSPGAVRDAARAALNPPALTQEPRT